MRLGGMGFSELVRCGLGGTLMGLANLVPGISGGTMLLAAGIYRKFVDSVASISSLKINLTVIFTLAAIGIPAAASILIFAGLFRDLVMNYRWVMYSIFIGLTLGGIPVILSQLKTFNKALLFPLLCGVAIMILTLVIKPGDPAQGESMVMMFIAGLLGASAMVLPGLSGGYILLVMGQYVAILNGVDLLKIGLKTQDFPLLMAGLKVCLPVGIGVALGVVGVSHIIKYFLNRYEQGTYGLLLGLLIGAVFGLWPFQNPVAPKIGDIVRGKILTTQELVDAVDGKYFSVEFFTPAIGQMVAAILLVVAGLVVTLGVDWAGKKLEHQKNGT